MDVRTKGIRGEEEVCRYIIGAMIQVEIELGMKNHIAALSSSIARNLNQSRDGGCDIEVPKVAAIEVKRREVISLNPWWEQTTKAAAKLGAMPVLVWRPNGRQPWRVRTWAAVHTEWVMADMLMEDWLRGFKAMYRQRLQLLVDNAPK